jgi:hypothetical protein
MKAAVFAISALFAQMSFAASAHSADGCFLVESIATPEGGYTEISRAQFVSVMKANDWKATTANWTVEGIMKSKGELEIRFLPINQLAAVFADQGPAQTVRVIYDGVRFFFQANGAQYIFPSPNPDKAEILCQ